LVDLEEVPLPKSSPSMSAVRRPLVAASTAAPAPVAPPPMMSTSNSSFARSLRSCSRLDGAETDASAQASLESGGSGIPI
jgi:hypothetical protein